MTKINLSLCALALSMAASSSFAASQGTITFNGKLIADTCNIASTDVNKQVTLPTLSTQTLTTAGALAGSTTFEINVDGCPEEITSVATHFEAINSDGFNASTGNLTNSIAKAAGGAEKVEIRLFDIDGSTQIPIGGTGSLFPVDATAHTAKMSYIGAYYATGATVSGDVSAKVQYTLAYQ